MKDRLVKIKIKLVSLLHDEKGGVITTFLLVLLPLLMFMHISRAESSRVLRATTQTLEKGVEESARNAAMMIDPASQSRGEPLIDHNRAIEMLEDYLKFTLGLDNNFKGDITTSLDDVKYWAIVYNGTSDYEGYKYDEDIYGDYYPNYDISYMTYYTSEGDMLEVDQKPGESSVTFYVNDVDGISYADSKDSVKVTLDAPGVLLVAQAKVNPVILAHKDSNKEVVTRWAYAKIVTR